VLGLKRWIGHRTDLIRGLYFLTLLYWIQIAMYNSVDNCGNLLRRKPVAIEVNQLLGDVFSNLVNSLKGFIEHSYKRDSL